MHDMNSRPYMMVARADSVAQTREQILKAAFELGIERLTPNVSLGEVANRAGVTVRTILRHFGSREGLHDAVFEYAKRLITEERATPVGDIHAAVAAVVQQYDVLGDYVLSRIEEARLDERVAVWDAEGRRRHREWVRRVFAPQLDRADDATALEDLLVIACDVYTWKLLRRDAGHSRKLTEERIETMIRRLVGEEV